MCTSPQRASTTRGRPGGTSSFSSACRLLDSVFCHGPLAPLYVNYIYTNSPFFLLFPFLWRQDRDSSLLVDGERHPHVELLEDVGTFLSGARGGGWVVGALADVIGRAAGTELESKELAAIM